jgi:transposase-like protein
MDDTRTYGLIDIARELGRSRQLLAQWRRRGKLPSPDAVVSGRPVWWATTIEPWIKEQADAPVDPGPPPKEPR